MGRYRGRREASRPEREKHGSTPLERPEAGGPAEVGDPFADDAERVVEKKRFFRTKAGRILIIVLACVAAAAVGGMAALGQWIKAPTLPVQPDSQEQQTGGQGQTPDISAPPTDDELYPDDGYGGEMPTLSGERKEGVYTFLLVGTDKDDGNTDTIMVASYDTVNQNVSIMSIPRDTMINEKWDIKKINSVYSRTGSSIESLAKRVQKLVGFKPDFYVKVDLTMFVELVDLVGGVEFDVPQDMDYDDPWQDLHIHLKKGVQLLDGEKAMQLVRFRRYAEGDIKRVEVQQNFLKALIKECLDIKHWGKIKAYIDLAMENVQTDLEFGSVVWFAANVLGLNSASALSMDSVYTCTIPGNYWASAWSRDTHQNQSYVTIYPNQVVQLVNERFNPYLQNVTTGMLDAMSILSNGDIASSTGSLRDTQHNAIMAVRRGEAYYDENGSIVYGTPPVTPEVDANGNYYILDEAGNVVYTDEKGTPLENPADPVIPGTETEPPSGGGTETPAPEDPVTAPEEGGEISTPPSEGEPTLPPEEPTVPEGGETGDNTDGDEAVDTEPPGWL